MAETVLQQEHIETLDLPLLSLEVFAHPTLPEARVRSLMVFIERLWPQFLRLAEQEALYDTLPVPLAGKALEVELTWTNNGDMQTLNRDYRQKDQPTDVLTFTMLADAVDPAPWLSLPSLPLGGIFISVDWAEEAVKAEPGRSIEHYLLERFVHGMLHLFGMHHDTMEKYEQVVRFQKLVLAAAFEQPGLPSDAAASS